MPSLLLTLATACLIFAPPEVSDSPEGTQDTSEVQPASSSSPQPEPPSAPSIEFQIYENDPIGVKQIVLDNGLTVLLSENHERPQVFGAVVVRTGGKNDPADNTGMAHYLEHMLFKGTTALGTSDWAAEQPLQAQIIDLYERHKQADSDEARARLQAEIAEVVEQTYAFAVPNELDAILSQTGGSGVNAFTTSDETVYHNTFPASQIETWLQVYGHRFAEPVFRLFPTELEAVYEEKNISLDRFEVKLFEAFSLGAFPDHPYGTQSVLGEIEHLKQPSLVAMREYFDRYYVANNMALVLSGDFEAEQVMPLIEAHFGSWRRGPQPEARTGTVEPFDGRELLELRITPIRVGAYGFRTVPPSHPDHAALMVARELLFNEQGSGFIDGLMDEGKILIALPISPEFADHGFDAVFFAPKIFGQTFKRAEALVLDQFHRIGRGEFDDRQMLALRDALRRGEDRQWEDNEERALALADGFIRHEGWQGYLDHRERLATVTRDDVTRVARAYFGDDYLALRSRLGRAKKPHLDKPHYPAVTPQPGVHSLFYEELMSRPSPAPALRLVDFDADVTPTPVREGVVLRTNPNPFNDTYSLRLVFGVGTDKIRELPLATEYIERIGTQDHAPAAFREQLSALGTTLEFQQLLHQTHVILTGPEEHLEAALALLDELLREPVADAKRWKALRRERAGFEKVERQNLDQVSGALGHYVLYGQNSAFLYDFGRRGMRGLSAEDLLAAWREAQSYAVELRYVGQRPPAEVAAIIDDSLQLEGARQPALAPVVYPRVLPERDTVYFLPHRGAIQSRLFFFVEGGPVPREQLAAADAYSEYMGGSMAGIVFQEIREFRALAYSTHAQFRRDTDPAQAGYFIGAVGCQADKSAESIAVMMGLIRDLPTKPERMADLRSALVRGLETKSPGFRYLQQTIEYWKQLGYEADPRSWQVDAYGSLDFTDVEAFYAAHVGERPVILTVVGDPRRVDVRELEKYGEVVKVKQRQIFAR